MKSYKNISEPGEHITSMYEEVLTNFEIIWHSFAATRAVLSWRTLKTSQNQGFKNVQIWFLEASNTQLIVTGAHTQNLK